MTVRHYSSSTQEVWSSTRFSKTMLRQLEWMVLAHLSARFLELTALRLVSNRNVRFIMSRVSIVESHEV